MRYNKIKSYAKLNLALNITGKAHSLHKVESIIAFIDLHDLIMIKRANTNRHDISFNGKFSKKIGKNNTVTKLLKILEKRKILINKKFQIKINKKIPNKAGLGGGSMNAANILKYFIKKNLIKVNNKEIIEICNLIGSDVFLGLNSTYSIMNSKKKIKYFYNCKKFYTLIVKPNFGCSTKYVYSKVRKFNKPKLNRPNKKMFNFDYLKKMRNSLEPIVLTKSLKLRSIKLFLENLSNPSFVRMTGSGSALVAYFQSKKRCDNAKKHFNKKYKNYWCIASKTI
jgi:4-diphosphocytidyl-2-C-methyl-D-erythritol kinase